MKRQPTTQQITWFLDLYRSNQLDLDPPYQRKSVWSSSDRKFFLDTIFRNYPAPPVFIHRLVDDNGFTKYFVVDGKQRLETIILFFENRLAIAANFGDSNIDGKRFKQIPTEYKRKFWDYTIVVDFIDSIDGTNIEEVFDRVNRNARNLQPQELRHARFNGWFINLVEDEADLDFWWKYKISTRARDKRMKNVQFISELFIILLDNEIAGFDQLHLDSKYANFDDIEDLIENHSFNPDQFTEDLKSLKSFIEAMNSHNNCIDRFVAGSNNNFYTLWAYLYLNQPENPTLVADNYLRFMELVSSLNDELIEQEGIDENASNYYQNSRGASTDLFQREARLKVLNEILGK
jgi:hypothetical protein